MVRSRAGAGRRHRHGEYEPGPDRAGTPDVPARGRADGRRVTEDSLAYFRDAREFRNYTLLELPHHGPLAGTAAAERDYATTIARNFLYSALMLLLWPSRCSNRKTRSWRRSPRSRSRKPATTCAMRATGWCGWATAPANRDSAHAALDHLMPYTQEFWTEWEPQAKAASAEPASTRAVARGLGRRSRRSIGRSHVAAAGSRRLRSARQGRPAFRTPGLHAGRDAGPRAPASGGTVVSSGAARLAGARVNPRPRDSGRVDPRARHPARNQRARRPTGSGDHPHLQRLSGDGTDRGRRARRAGCQ